MTDDDLLLLIDEETRLYRAYVAELNGSTRLNTQAISAAAVTRARDAWIGLLAKMDEVLTPAKRRELLQSRVNDEDQEVRRAR